MDNSSYFSENVVKCFFYISHSKSEAYWDETVENINTLIQSISKKYLWHKDQFRVFRPILNENSSDFPSHIASYTCFGDNIEDEWFIVYILLEISKKYHDLIIQVQDEDGEFLLIEAADYLPQWANPDTTENRVFIQNGRILIIPPHGIGDSELDIIEAINIVGRGNVIYINEIEEAILKRIGNYPDKMKDVLHYPVVKIPIDIAALLHIDPSLISDIIHTYCNSDTIDAKSCRNLSLDNCVNVKVKFTKCLYAMLVHAKLLKNNKHTIRVKSDDKSMLIGLKLACGYQMIMNRKNTDIFSSREYQKFLNKLKDIGYFKNNLEGSQDYNQLLKEANDYFMNMECPISLHVNNKILKNINTEEFIKIREALNTQDQDIQGDNDDWLNIKPEQLNDLLTSRYNIKNKFKTNDIITTETITTELSNFLKKSSDFEGIEINEEENSNTIDFDAGEFSEVLTKMANFIFSDDKEYLDNSDLSLSDDESNNDDDLENELKVKLKGNDRHNAKKRNTIKQNFTQSLREEGPSGPSNNLLRSIGIKKTDMLDSDDDE